jgi:hypothetical protein
LEINEKVLDEPKLIDKVLETSEPLVKKSTMGPLSTSKVVSQIKRQDSEPVVDDYFDCIQEESKGQQSEMIVGDNDRIIGDSLVIPY